MILIAIFLVIIGFFFPPAWLALAGYGIYIFASRRSRRNDAVESRVSKMVSAGKNYAIFSDLYFEAAKSYAIEKGAKAADQMSASARILVDGRTYFVVFTKAANGGTMISVEDVEAVKRRVFDEPMENLLKSSNSSSGPGDTSSSTFSVGGFSFDGDTANDEEWARMVSKIARRVIELSPTELDIYRYLMEEADRLSEGGGIGKIALENSGIKPLEYEGEMSKAHKYPDNRASLDYLNLEVSPDLNEALGADRAGNIRAMIFTFIVHSNISGVNEIRRKYAVHYANNCMANGHYGYADKWDEVIGSIL